MKQNLRYLMFTTLWRNIVKIENCITVMQIVDCNKMRKYTFTKCTDTVRSWWTFGNDITGRTVRLSVRPLGIGRKLELTIRRNLSWCYLKISAGFCYLIGWNYNFNTLYNLNKMMLKCFLLWSYSASHLPSMFLRCGYQGASEYQPQCPLRVQKKAYSKHWT